MPTVESDCTIVQRCCNRHGTFEDNKKLTNASSRLHVAEVLLYFDAANEGQSSAQD